MNCCSGSESVDDLIRACQRCQSGSLAITHKTILLMLKPECFDLVSDAQYRFCSSPGCSIVYFTEDGTSFFTTDDLRLRVGLKETEDPDRTLLLLWF